MKATLIRLSPWLALLLAGSLAFGLAGAFVGALVLATAEVLQFLREARAMDAAHSMALAQRTRDSEAQAARLTEIEKQLKLLATPEKIALFEKFQEYAKRVGLGRGTA